MGLNHASGTCPPPVQRGAAHRSSGTIQRVITVSTFRLAGGNHATQYFPASWFPPGPLAKPRLNTGPATLSVAPGSYRYKEDAENNHLVLAQ